MGRLRGKRAIARRNVSCPFHRAKVPSRPTRIVPCAAGAMPARRSRSRRCPDGENRVKSTALRMTTTATSPSTRRASPSTGAAATTALPAEGSPGYRAGWFQRRRAVRTGSGTSLAWVSHHSRCQPIAIACPHLENALVDREHVFGKDRRLLLQLDHGGL